MGQTALGVVFALALVATGCSTSATDEARTDPVVRSVPAVRVMTAVTGGSAQQRVALREILGRMGKTQVARASIEPAPASWAYDSNSFILRMKLTRDADRRGQWEADLVGYAFADRSRELSLPRVAAYEAAGEGIAVDGPDPQPLPTSPMTSSGLEAAIRGAASRSDAEVVGLEILQPRLLAAVVTLKVDDPAIFLVARAQGFLMALRDQDVLVRLVDEHGTLVWSTVDGVVRLELRGCDRTPLYGGPPDPPPPPCPAG